MIIKCTYTDPTSGKDYKIAILGTEIQSCHEVIGLEHKTFTQVVMKANGASEAKTYLIDQNLVDFIVMWYEAINHALNRRG